MSGVAPLRILVTGGRDYDDINAVWRALDRLHADFGIAAIIQGGASGADRLAAEWGWLFDAEVVTFAADWSQGKRAGPERNQRMIDEGKPDAVVAFPGGCGTADMCRRAGAAGLKIWKPVK